MIFYFSATGNSRKLAEVIGKRIDEHCIDIESAIRSQKFEYSPGLDELLGFVFPVYFGGVPDIVRSFIEKITVHTSEKYYCFVAVTYGSSHGNVTAEFSRLLIKRGLTTNASFGVKTVDTFLPLFVIPTGDERRRIDEAAELQSAFAAEQIAEKMMGEQIQKEMAPYWTSLMMKPLYAVMRRTKYLHVTDACSGCGLCAENCPVGAIAFDEEKHRPVWKMRECMMCLRCLHHCPEAAVEYGNRTRGKSRYDVSRS